MPSYNLKATEVPAVQTVLAALYATSSPPVPVIGTAVTSGTSAAAQALPTTINADQVRGNLNGRYGGGCYAVWTGLELTAGSGLTLNISAGIAGLDGPAEVTAATTFALTDGVVNYVWISRGGTINAVTSATASYLSPPDAAKPWAYLGAVTVSGGAIQGIDYSGRLQQDQGNLAWRKTADTGEPGDTPASTVRFLTRTGGGLYLWDGVEYWQIGVSDSTSDDVADLQDDQEDQEDLFDRLLMVVFRSPLGEGVVADERLQCAVLRAAEKGF